MEPPHSGSDRIAELLGQEPELDEVTRARMEKNLLAAVAAGKHLDIVETPFAVETVKESSVDEAPDNVVRGPWNAVSIGAVVAAAAAAAVLVWSTGPDEGDGASDRATASFLRLEAGETVDRGAIEAGAEVDTDDGERVEVRVADARVDVTPGSLVRFDRVDASRVEVYLSRGSVDVELHPERTGDQTLRVSTDVADVDVIGTVFTVTVDEEGETHVETVEGTVRVTPRDEGETRLVEAGEEARFGSVDVESAVALETEDLAEELAEDLAEDLAADGTGDSAGDSTDDLAADGDEAAAERLAGEESAIPGEGAEVDSPPPAQIARAASISDRLTRAEAALDGGDHRGARRMLESVAATAPRAADRVRAHTLMAESFTAQRNFQAAAEAYGQAVEAGGRTMGAQNALFAMGRLFERQMHNTGAAQSAYRDYLELAPEGAHATRVEGALCGLGEAEYCR